MFFFSIFAKDVIGILTGLSSTRLSITALSCQPVYGFTHRPRPPAASAPLSLLEMASAVSEATPPRAEHLAVQWSPAALLCTFPVTWGTGALWDTESDFPLGVTVPSDISSPRPMPSLTSAML